MLYRPRPQRAPAAKAREIARTYEDHDEIVVLASSYIEEGACDIARALFGIAPPTHPASGLRARVGSGRRHAGDGGAQRAAIDAALRAAAEGPLSEVVGDHLEAALHLLREEVEELCSTVVEHVEDALPAVAGGAQFKWEETDARLREARGAAISAEITAEITLLLLAEGGLPATPYGEEEEALREEGMTLLRALASLEEKEDRPAVAQAAADLHASARRALARLDEAEDRLEAAVARAVEAQAANDDAA